MALEVYEHYTSRSFTLGRQSGSRRVYKIRGTEDEQAVRLFILAEAPLTDDQGHLRMTADVKPKGNGLWEATIDYALGERESQTPPGENSHKPQESESIGHETTFDTTGGTDHITQSILTLDKQKPNGDARAIPNTSGIIGLSEHGVAGVDVAAPKLTWVETWKFPMAAINWAYVRRLRDMTGMVNKAKFRTFEALEVSFGGASGSPDGTDKYRIAYTFHGAKNQPTLALPSNFGNGKTINKPGWYYLQFLYEWQTVGAFKFQVPYLALTEQVSPEDDFTKIGIGS